MRSLFKPVEGMGIAVDVRHERRAFRSRAARGMASTTLASLCGLLCVLAMGVVPAAAGATQFGAEGREAGQLNGAFGVGLDQETGDVYVGEFGGGRVSKFDGSGSFLFAWGWRVNEEHPAVELQTCTVATGCLGGNEGSGAGQFTGTGGAEGVAVDNDPLSFSYKDVYVVDFSNHRVQKFDPSGKFLLMFGGHVNEAKDNTPAATEAEKDVCIAGEACTRGSEGTDDGEFEWAYKDSYIAVGPGGAVYVGDKARVQVFEPSGAWRENVSLTGLSSTGKVTALTVDSAGDMFLADEGVAGVREFEPGGIEKATQFDAGSTSIEAITVDKAGELFVADGTGGFHIAEYDPSGVQLSSFGSKTAGEARGIVFSESLDELYTSTYASIFVLTPSAPGPVIAPESERATAELRGAATLEAVVNPEGNATTAHFEYVDDKSFKENGYASATSTKPQSIGSSFGEEQVTIHLPAKTLLPGVTYHWRVVAVDSSNRAATAPDQSFQEIPAALVEGPWASNVAGTSATLSASIDPQGANTTYRLEYGTGSSYEHVFSGNVGEGMGYVTVSYHIQELQGHTTYNYRLVTESEVGTVEIVHSFTTQPAGEERNLPDGRAWELVSPPDKQAASIGPPGGGLHEESLTQAAIDGNALTYKVREPIGENTVGHIWGAQILSTRTADGWRTQDIAGRGGLPPEGETAKEDLLSAIENWRLFSPNLSQGLMEPGPRGTPPQSAEATERTLYLRDSATGDFQPLESEADVPVGLKFGDEEMVYYTATPDLSHVVLGTWKALTPEAVSEVSSCSKGCANLNVYEWYDGRLQLVNVLPNGTTSPGATAANAMSSFAWEMTGRAPISSDGRWVVWKYGGLTPPEGDKVSLYVRDMVNKQTFKVGGPNARFEAMSSDGSKIFYVETEKGSNGDLHVFDTATDTQTDLTAGHGSAEPSAGVQNAVIGTSQDGSYVYFVATGVLASGAVSGADNLYMLHDGSGGWVTTYIASLSEEDEHTWGSEGGTTISPWQVDSEVSPSGRYMAFMSNSPLTGYDNRDAVSGQRDEEVFLYDAASNRLACASCNPTGARPVGVLDQGSLLVDSEEAWCGHCGLHGGSDHWLAGSLVAWSNLSNRASYQPRYVMDSGRLFFNSPDALVPQDTNGLEDVYQYEPSGVGSCTEATSSGSTVYAPSEAGCVGLISSGQSSAESGFMDSSESGDDVFFVTSSKLVSGDYDNAYDVYDAHVCTSAAPCRAEPVSPPECTSGDSCKAAPSPQPTIFGATPSATFSGVGNVAAASSGVVVSKSLTRTQKLARALRVCRKKKGRKKKAVCERQARKSYGAKKSGKAKTTRKGNR